MDGNGIQSYHLLHYVSLKLNMITHLHYITILKILDNGGLGDEDLLSVLLTEVPK